MIPNSYIEYYGDDVRWFIGRAIDVVNDPLRLGRIQVRIFGIHPESTNKLANSDLPWAQVMIPTTEPGVSGLGKNAMIKKMAMVFGIFMDGKNSQLPLVLGSIPVIENAQAETTTKKTITPDDSLLVGTSNIEKAFNYFVSAEGGGFTEKQAAGILGNFMQESGTNGDINPKALNNNEGSYGIAQWYPGGSEQRYQRLLSYSKDIGFGKDKLYTQLQYTNYELSISPWLGLGELRQSTTIEEATKVFMDKFERPNKLKANFSQRLDYAQNIYENLTA